MRRVKKILLVDDDEITCYLEKSLLEDLEVAEEITYVHGGYEALEYIEKCLQDGDYPDIIFLDINMPGMDGFEFLEKLDSLGSPEIRKLNIVMLTSSVNMKDVQKAGSFGDLLKGYITKPLEVGAVKKVLDSIWGLKNNQREKEKWKVMEEERKYHLKKLVESSKERIYSSNELIQKSRLLLKVMNKLENDPFYSELKRQIENGGGKAKR